MNDISPLNEVFDPMPVPGTSRRTCLLVLGMHRSGTSALTRVLSLAGAKLPQRLIGAGPGNDQGHWEPPALVDYFDRLLGEVGSSWHDWQGPDLTRLPPGRRDAIGNEIADIIAKDYQDASLFVVKDPRVCRMAPLVMEALERAGCQVVPVLTFRNPLDVMRSLEVRTQYWPEGYSRADAALLWLRHVLDAERVTRGMRRAIVSYDGLLRDWRTVIDEVARRTGCEFPFTNDEIEPQVAGFLSDKDRHHSFTTEELLFDGDLRGSVSDAYEAMRILERNPQSQRALAELDAIASSLNRFLPALVALANAGKSAREEAAEQARVQLDVASEERRTLEEHLKEAEQRAAESARELMELRNSISWRLTAPVRGVRYTQFAISRWFKIVTAALRVGGGVVPSVRQAIWVWRREGMAGVRERIAYVAPRNLRMPAVATDSMVSRLLPLQTGPTIAAPAQSNVSAYLDQVLSIAQKRSSVNLNYIPKSPQAFDLSNCPIKAIAFYLPQFHPIPENDLWWGKGFTEWTNVSKAVPQFVGHYQPHLPDELGFYDLRLVDVQRQQIALAKHYGILGFCYHHYWFGGKRLLERPVNQILANPDLDLPFCLCWANENWTRRWDGLDHDILIGQNHSPEDDLAFIEDIASALRDPRYIRFKGRPLLIVYRVNLLPDARATAKRWRDYCRAEGIGELYLVAARSFGTADPRPYGFDAAVEFPPLESRPRRINKKIHFINPDFDGAVYQYDEMVDSYLTISASGYPNIKTVCPSWDNEARKPGKGHIFYGAGVSAYSRWLRGACEQTLHAMSKDPDQPPFVFVNAWNEWAEGAHLEPDRKFGYAHLHATANALQEFKPREASIEAAILQSQANFRRTSDGALVLHLYYADLLPELKPYLENAHDMDLFISLGPDVPPSVVAQLRSDFPNSYLVMYRNCGRDTMPFMKLLQVLVDKGYVYGCKVHSKKSPHRDDGGKLRNEAFEVLLGSRRRVERITKMFQTDPSLGIVAGSQAMLNLDDVERNFSNRFWLDTLLPRLGRSEFVGNYRWHFVAGTMFWFRVAALERLLSLEISESDFEDELGQLDGTLAHAIERVTTLCCITEGFAVKTLDLQERKLEAKHSMSK